MKRCFLLLALVCLSALPIRAQVTVSGNLKDVGVANVTASNTYVRFTLTGFGGNIPRVTGTNAIAVPYKDFKPDANGNISGNLQGNDTITIGGNSQPGGTWYQVCIYYQGQPFRCAPYTINGSTFNLNNAIANSTTPTVPAPTGDNTYIRKDGGNNPITGALQFIGAQIFKNLENVRMVEPTNAAGWAGSDVGAWINSACKDLPAAGGVIYVNGFTTATANNSDWAAGCTASKVTVLLGRVNLLMNQVGVTTYAVQPLSGWHIIGSGPGNTNLKLNSNVSFVRIFDTPEGITDFSLENLELDGNFPVVNQGNAQNHCLMLRDAYKFAIKGNYIHNCNGSGVLVWGGGTAGTAFTGEVVGTGNGVLTTFDYTVLNPQIKPGSITITAGAVTGTDAAQFPGVITGTGNPLNLRGSYEPGTGEMRLIFASAVANATSITINYTGGAGAQQASTNGEISGNWTKNNTTAGFGLISSRDVNVHDNYDYTTLNFQGIDVEPSNVGQYAMDLNIHDNQMRGLAGISLTCQVQGTATLCRNNHVHHNTATAGATIKLQRHIDTEVSGNLITNALDPLGPLQLTGRSYTVTGNTIGPSSVPLTSSGCAAGIVLDSTSTNDTSGLPAGTGNSVISNNHVDRAYVNGICVFNSSNNVIAVNPVTNTLVNQGNANGIRLANTVANLTNLNLLVGNHSDDNQTVATQVNGYLFDAGVTNTKFFNNTGTGNTTNLLLDNGTSTFRLDDTNAVTLAGAQTLTNKTLTNPVINGVNAQTGTTYTFVVADEQKLVTFNNAAAIAVTLPQATTTGFGAGTAFHVRNLGTGTATITPTVSTIDGAASLALTTGQGADIYSDGTNYVTQRGAAASAGVTEATISNQGGIMGAGSTGTCASSPPGTQCAVTVLPSAHTLIRLTYMLNTSPAGCTTAMVIGVRDNTSSTVLTSITVSNGQATGLVDSGALSIAMTAGDQFGVGVTTAAAGCTTQPQVLDAVMVYR